SSISGWESILLRTPYVLATKSERVGERQRVCVCVCVLGTEESSTHIFSRMEHEKRAGSCMKRDVGLSLGSSEMPLATPERPRRCDCGPTADRPRRGRWSQAESARLWAGRGQAGGTHMSICDKQMSTMPISVASPTHFPAPDAPT